MSDMMNNTTTNFNTIQILIKDIPKYYLQGLYTETTLDLFIGCGYISNEYISELIKIKHSKM